MVVGFEVMWLFLKWLVGRCQGEVLGDFRGG